MEGIADLKIWKYMDLAKFLSLLTTKSLYFASPAQFQDLSEGSMPKSHVDAMGKVLQGSSIDRLLPLRPHFAALSPAALKQFDDILKKIPEEVRTAYKQVPFRFGISCWHKSDYESEAMWKLYSASGQAIAVESTVGKLRASLGNAEGVIIDSVRYADFANDPIEKGHQHYSLFMKRKSFEHEKELRATILLPQEQWTIPEDQRGLVVPCDLDVLINQIHVSPLCAAFVVRAVEDLCTGKAHFLNKPVIYSSLLRDTGHELPIELPADLLG